MDGDDTEKVDKESSTEANLSVDLKAISQDTNSVTIKRSKRKAYRNVYGVGVSVLLCFSSVLGLAALQSTINALLGLVSLVTLFVGSVLIGFVTVGLTAVFGTKYNFIIGYSFILVYILCNYYQSWYTLIPGAILGGAGIGILWAAIPAHIAGVAGLVAPIIDKERAYLISKYTGIVLFLYYASYIPGNLASSLIFYPYNYNATEVLPYTDFTESDFEHSGSTSVNVTMPFNANYVCEKDNSNTLDVIHFYSLLSVYVAFLIASILIVIFCVDHLPTENSFFSSDRKIQLYLKKPLIELLRILKCRKMMLLAPVMFVAGVIPAFAFGTFTKYFISDCFGLYLVGFTIILLGISSSAMSMAYSKIIKRVPRFIFVLFATALNIGFIVFLLLWERVPSYGFIFSFAVLWGVSDSIWNAVAASLPGILFPDRSVEASSVFTIAICSGYAVGYLIATVLKIEGQLWIIFSIVILAVLSELVIEFAYVKGCTFCANHKDLRTNQTTVEIHKTHADCNGGSLQNSATGVNALFSIYQNRRPSTQSMFIEESKHPDKCSSSMSDVAIAEPCLVSEKEERTGTNL